MELTLGIKENAASIISVEDSFVPSNNSDFVFRITNILSRYGKYIDSVSLESKEITEYLANSFVEATSLSEISLAVTTRNMLQGLFSPIQYGDGTIEFLNEFSFLKPILAKAYSMIMGVFGDDSKIRLEISSDIDSGYRTLLIKIIGSFSVNESIVFTDEFDNNWFLNQENRVLERINILPIPQYV